MRKSMYLRLSMLFACLAMVSLASASTINLLPATLSSVERQPGNDPVTVVPFPTAGDAYCSATNGCGTIPSGGQTASQWTAGDFVLSSVFTIPTNSVTDLTANVTFQDFLGGGNNETWYVYLNGTPVAVATLDSCGFCGSYFTITGTVNFPDVAPVGGGYQLELVLQNTIPSGGGSVAWADGGLTGLSYTTTTPEPGSLLLLGSGMLALAGTLRGKFLRKQR